MRQHPPILRLVGRRSYIKSVTAVYAHTPAESGGEWHGLTTHLEATAQLARERAQKFAADDFAHAAGLLHDVGKYNPAFQKRLRDLHEDRPAERVPHAIYGALLAMERGETLLAPIVLGHHSGLPSRADLQDALTDPETAEAWQSFRGLVPPALVDTNGKPEGITSVLELELVADKAYDSRSFRGWLRSRGIKPTIPSYQRRERKRPKRGRPVETGASYAERWKVERTFAWLGNFRRLLVRQERYLPTFRAFFLVAFILVTLRQF